MKKKTNGSNIMIVAMIISIMLFSIAVFAFVSSRYGSNYQKAVQSENSTDICKAPAGYTQQEWETHMSHHPDRYGQCLQK